MGSTWTPGPHSSVQTPPWNPRSVMTTPVVAEVAKNMGLLKVGDVVVIAPAVEADRKLTPRVNPDSPLIVDPLWQ